VKETLRHTARFRLPAELTIREKYDVVDDVISSVNLDKAADTIVGSVFPFKRGVSGGEKKRLNIANELLTNPGVLFVDEPTSGLDSSTSFVVISLLKELAQRGCTIVTTIHQPSSQIFALFDRLMLMADGNVVYMGKAENATAYMASITLPCPSNFNPSDYLLELLVERIDENGNPLKFKLIEEYKKKNPPSENPNNNEYEEDDTDFGEKYPSSWFEQFSVLFSRNLKMKSDRLFTYLALFQYLAMIAACLVVWFDRDHEYDSVADRAGLLFFSFVYFNVSPLMVTIMQFGMDRQVHERERATGTYRLSAFYLARVASDAPLECIFPCLFACIVYWTSNLNHDVWRFFCFLILLWVVVFNGVCTGLMFACLYLDIQTGTVYALSYFLLCMLLGGFFVQHIQVWISWCRYISAIFYAFNIALMIEFDDDAYCFRNSTSTDTSSNGVDEFVCGPTILHDDYDVDTNHWWSNIIGLIGLSFLALVIGYFSLRHLNRPK
jgi:ATP-binding cassette, subfamily G (WHITE), member 2